jgi:hypothetical protein
VGVLNDVGDPPQGEDAGQLPKNAVIAKQLLPIFESDPDVG